MDEEKLSLSEKVREAVLPRGPQSIAEPEKELRFTRTAQAGMFFAAAVVVLLVSVAVALLSTSWGWGSSDGPLQGWGWLALIGLAFCYVLLRLGLRCARHAYIILSPLGVEIFPFFKAKDSLQVIYWSQVTEAEFSAGEKVLTLHFTEEKKSGVIASLKPMTPSRRQLLKTAVMGVMEKRDEEID